MEYLKEVKQHNKYIAVLLALLIATSTAFGWTQSAAPATSTTLSATEQQLVNKISIATIKETVNALAANDMEGRGTAQPGGDKAATYLADRFAKLGLKQLGDKNTYLQPIRFREMQFLPQTAFTVGNENLKFGSDYFVSPRYSGDENINARMVFVAYGVDVPFLKRKDLAGVDLRGKIAVIHDGPPPEIARAQWDKAQAQGSVIRGLIMRGVAAVVTIGQSTETITFPELADYLTRRRIEPESSTELPDFIPPFLSVSTTAAEKLFASSGMTFAGDADLRLWVLRVERWEVHIGAGHPTLGTGKDRRVAVEPRPADSA